MRSWVLALIVVLGLVAVHHAEPPPAPVRTIPLAVGSTIRLQMTSKKLLKTVINEKENIVRVSPLPNDATAVLVTGLNPGVTRITLIAADGEKEVCRLGGPPVP